MYSLKSESNNVQTNFLACKIKMFITKKLNCEKHNLKISTNSYGNRILVKFNSQVVLVVENRIENSKSFKVWSFLFRLLLVRLYF